MDCDDSLSRVEASPGQCVEEQVTCLDPRVALVLEARRPGRQDAPHVWRADDVEQGLDGLVGDGAQKVYPWSGTSTHASFTRLGSWSLGLSDFVRL